MAHRDLLIGSELAGYRIEALIGRGGMGAVYQAEQIALGRKIALKVLPPELAESEDFRRRFERESRLAASLDHPHVIPIIESGEADGVLFIAMRLVEGTDLATLIANEGFLAIDRAASIVSQVGSALDAAHAKGLVHRDVKPGNVLVMPGSPDEEEDYAYLSDFGLTRLTDSNSALTRTGQFMGTVAYAAPEQFQGRPADAASDLYSLGCVAFECVTGERPFPRDQEAAVMFAHLQEDPPRASERRPGVPADLDNVLAKAMAKKPEERFATGRALGRAMREAVGVTSGSLPSAPARLGPAPPGPGSEPGAPGDSGSPPAAPVPPPAGAARRRRRYAVPAAIVAVVLAATVVVIASRGGPDDREGTDTSPGASASASATPSPSPSSTGPAAPPGLAIEPDHLVRLDPDTGEVTASYAVGSQPGPVAVSGGAVWVVNYDDVTVSKVDMATGHVTTRGGFAGPCGVYPAPGGGVWIDSCELNEIQRVDPDSFEVVQRIPVENPAAVLNAHGSVWAVSFRGDNEPSILHRFSPSGRVQATITLGPGSWVAALADDGSLWGNDYGDGTIWRVDPDSEKAEFVDGWTGPDGVVAAGDSLWISDGQQDSTTRYEYVTGQTKAVVPGHPGIVAVTPGAVWIQEGFGDTLTKVDPETGQIVEEFQLGYSSEMTFGGGSLWITADRD